MQPRLTVVSGSLPEPPYSERIVARGRTFDLDVDRIERSTTWVKCPLKVRPWLLMLWMMSWRNVPCGAFPDDDNVIAGRIGMPLKLFKIHRDVLLRGWIRHSDGRLYHVFVTEMVLKMLSQRVTNSARQANFKATTNQALSPEVTRYSRVSNALASVSNALAPASDCFATGREETDGDSRIEPPSPLSLFPPPPPLPPHTPPSPPSPPNSFSLLPPEVRNEELKGGARGGKQKRTFLNIADLQQDGLSVDVARDWLAHRDRIKFPLTATAWSTIKAEAAKAQWSLEQAVREAMNCGWRGFKASWVRKDQGASRPASRNWGKSPGV